MLLSYLITFIGDLIVAWALYIYVSPVNKFLSLLTVLFRIIFSVIAVVSLLNLVTVYNLTAYADNKMYDQVMFSLNAFRNNFHFAIVFFAIHLLLLGYLAIKADYIPTIMGILLIISGLGYLASSLKPFLLPNVNLDLQSTPFSENLYLWYGYLRKVQEQKR